MATTNYIAEKWGVKSRTVAEYCASGMVPAADKIDGKWVIPSDTPKPYCTSYKAAQYLKYIRSIQEGASPDIMLICKDQEKNIDSIDYLSSIGFCTNVKWVNSDDGQIDFEKSLRDVKITSDGKSFLSREERKQEKEDASETEGEAHGELTVGIAKLGGSVKKKR